MKEQSNQATAAQRAGDSESPARWFGERGIPERFNVNKRTGGSDAAVK